MKVKNKKTGEINILKVDEDYFNIYKDDGDICPVTIKQLNEGWEDYEEPKESEYYWYIGYKNDIRRTKYHHTSDFADNQVTETRKEIGNCFESLEEAEKAVKKLKAWKRLKDKGFRFNGWEIDQKKHLGVITIKTEPYCSFEFEDLDLLFGGEE